MQVTTAAHIVCRSQSPQVTKTDRTSGLRRPCSSIHLSNNCNRQRNKSVSCLFHRRCQISYTDVGNMSSQWKIDYNEETHQSHPHNALENILRTPAVWLYTVSKRKSVDKNREIDWDRITENNGCLAMPANDQSSTPLTYSTHHSQLSSEYM